MTDSALTDVLFYGATERSAAMRHELPVSIGDPFLLAVVGGRLHVTAGEVRFEDLLLVTDDGSETVTDYPFDLTP